MREGEGYSVNACHDRRSGVLVSAELSSLKAGGSGNLGTRATTKLQAQERRSRRGIPRSEKQTTEGGDRG